MRLLLLGLFIPASLVWAAPHPLTGSSIINSARNAISLAQLGFSVDFVPANWEYTRSVESDSPSIELGENRRTLLSFRLESVSVKTELEPYVRRHLRDYNQYGFEVTGLQSHSKSHVPSVIVDLKQKNKTARLRQVFFYKQNKLIIATCSDNSDTFDRTLISCNQVLGSFKWR